MIDFEDVAIVRGGRPVLAGVTFSIAAGHSVAVLGRGSAGKSSLIEALATILPPSHGDIRIDGHSVRSEPAAVRMRIGYVPTTPGAWPRVRADEWLELFAREAGLHGKPLRAAIAQALELAGLAGAASLDSLPAGQAKRLLFGRALLHGPDVLIVDDPFGGLDHEERHGIERLMVDFHLGGRIVVAAIEHDAPVRCFTHLALLGGGRLRGFAPAVRESFDDGHRPWRYRIGCPGGADDAAPLLRRLGVDTEMVDADTLVCRQPSSRLPMSEMVAALVRGGIAVESVGFDPPWIVQLVDDGA